FRISAFDRDHPIRRRSGSAIWHAAYLLECLGAGRPRLAPFAAAKSSGSGGRFKCSWASAHSSRRQQRPVLSAAQRWPIADRRAASTLHATSLADWLALPYWARSSIGWDGRLALRASRSP